MCHPQIEGRATAKGLPLKFHSKVDHLDSKLQDYKVMTDPLLHLKCGANRASCRLRPTHGHVLLYALTMSYRGIWPN